MDLERENRLLKSRLAKLTEEAAKNESILRRSQRREMNLLEAESLEDLLQAIVQGLADSYGLKAVTIFVCDPHHEVRHLMISDGVMPDRMSGVHFVDNMTGLAPQYAVSTKPWMGLYAASDHQLLFPGFENLGSVALMPLLRQHKLVGSLNFGSPDTSRFTRHLASDFLHHLSTIASFCLENAVNRARLVRSGLTDVLTGWHNRRYLQDRLRGELARAQRNRQPLVCLLLDVDHFKRVNDSHGHLAGDNVLREIAHRVECQVRASDVAARYGGEEFAVLLPNTSNDEAQLLAERILEAVSSKPIEIRDGLAITVTVSIGVSSIIPDRKASDIKSLSEGLLAEADVALYRAKAEGRNCVQMSQ